MKSVPCPEHGKMEPCDVCQEVNPSKYIRKYGCTHKVTVSVNNKLSQHQVIAEPFNSDYSAMSNASSLMNVELSKVFGSLYEKIVVIESSYVIESYLDIRKEK